MSPQALDLFGRALDYFDAEIDALPRERFKYYSDTRVAYRHADHALKQARRVLYEIENAKSCFYLGANSPFTRYVRDNIDNFDVPAPAVKRKKSFNQIIFLEPAFLEAATAAAQYAFNKAAIARCFRAAYHYPTAVVVARMHFDNGDQTREASLFAAEKIIDDAIGCAKLDNFLRASIRVFDDRDLIDVLKIAGNDQSYFCRRLDAVFDAVTRQCRANILKIWFED